MHYHQSREHSAELLRIALAHMGHQEAPFHPASYALWYEHAAGINPQLSAALDQRIASSVPLTDADVWRLYAQHIVTRDAEAIERIQERLLGVLQETADAVTSTGTQTVHFGERLEDHSVRLRQPPSLALVQDIVNELLAQTQHMCATNATLARQLNSSAKSVLNLTQRLQRTQTEAQKDALTGLLNRRGFERAVAELGSDANALQRFTLLVADIDHFKRINDSHGHLIGDQVLRAVGQVVRARIKGSDIAARLGGDEFAILLPATAITGAVALAEQIRTTLLEGRLRRVDRKQTVENITLSMGIAHARAGEQLEDLLRRADAALYTAKREGRNRVSLEPAPGAKR